MTEYKIKLFFRKENRHEQLFKLFKNLLLKITNIQLNYKQIGKKTSKTKIPILKSPHVNKSAQEHFQIITRRASMKYCIQKNKKDLLMIKKIKNNLFSDVKMKINVTWVSSKKKFENERLAAIAMRNKTNLNDINLFSFTQNGKNSLIIKTHSNKQIQDKNLFRKAAIHLKKLNELNTSKIFCLHSFSI